MNIICEYGSSVLYDSPESSSVSLRSTDIYGFLPVGYVCSLYNLMNMYRVYILLVILCKEDVSIVQQVYFGNELDHGVVSDVYQNTASHFLYKQGTISSSTSLHSKIF